MIKCMGWPIGGGGVKLDNKNLDPPTVSDSVHFLSRVLLHNTHTSVHACKSRTELWSFSVVKTAVFIISAELFV